MKRPEERLSLCGNRAWSAGLQLPGVRLYSTGNLQFRFDFINLFNHSNLGTVDPFMGDAAFGKVTTALNARQLQLAVWIAF